MKIIPSLGKSADEVLKNALNYNCAGFLLKFRIVCEGEWHFDSLLGKFIKVGWVGRIPVTEKIESGNFDGWLLRQIKRGFVGIYVEAGGKNPYYSLEIHRATGQIAN